jgi:hypothetical protein
MIVSWLSFIAFFIAALIHIGLFAYQIFILPQHTNKSLGSELADYSPGRIWANYLAAYHLSLALGVFCGLYLIFKKQIMLAGALTSFCGLTMIIAGTTLAYTNKKLLKIALLQIIPPLIGFLFLIAHVVDRLS